MRKEDFFEVLGELDGCLVAETKASRVKRVNLRIGGIIAACLCVAVGIAAARWPASPAPTLGGGAPVGAWPEGIDPRIASIAVFPADRDVREVETAVYRQIGEAEAYSMEGLGDYLPARLPEGITFHYAALYETTMKDGAKYHLLRAFYTTGEVIPSNVADGETGEPLPDALHDAFAVFVMDYSPNTRKDIHQPEELPAFLAKDWDGGTFHVAFGEVVIGFSPNDAQLSAEDILTVLRSITDPSEQP